MSAPTSRPRRGLLLPAKNVAPAPPDDCDHFRELSGPERDARRLGHEKRWGLCGHPKRVELGIAEVVCPCSGCGPRCNGYEVDGVRPVPRPAPPAGPKLVTIPPLSPLALPAPRSARAVVTVVTGAGAEALHAITRPYHEEFARRLGADYVVLRDPPPAPEFPLSAKFRLVQTLDYYERVCSLDADAAPLPGCPNPFEIVRPDEFGFHDDMPGLRRTGGFDHLIKEYHELRRAVGLHAARCEHILNTGVMVFSRAHRELLKPPVGPIPHRHLAEQSWYTARLHDLAPRVKLLPPACNYQYWEWDRFRSLRPTDKVIAHWSGLVPHRPPDERLELMRAFVAKVAAAHPAWEPPAELFPLSHLASIDIRHARWIRDTLSSGRFRRVLEIGCCDGYSTTAFLDACRNGWVDEVHLCEPFPRPTLERVIAHYGLGSRVTLHRVPSVELLARDARWDLVFADGDHEQPTVDVETRLLLAAGVRSVFVHDTNPAVMWPAPCRMKGAFQAGGYRGIEDMVRREGERTDRGLFFATKDEGAYGAALAAYRKRCAPGA